MNASADPRRLSAQPAQSPAPSPGWPVDAHVHLHRLERTAATLDAAAANCQAVGGRAQGLLGALLLAQAAGERVFEALERAPAVGEWRLEPARDEGESLLARRGEQALALVCGRQVRAAGGLEVLALGTRREFRDGREFAETLAEVRASGALTVLPWGFGKWLGPRRQVIEAALRASAPAELFVGDNGSRLAGAPPALVGDAERRGFRVLPGTDPFPFGSDFRRVGGFGFLAAAAPDERAPWRGLREWLLACPVSPAAFGRASSPLRFAFNQVGIQLYNQLRKRMPRSLPQ